MNIGDRFDEWTVLTEPIKKGNKFYVDCKCSCGKIKPVRTDGLLKKMSKSCGCQGREVKIGHVFNCFKVISSAYNKKRQNKTFKFVDCECQCGNIRSIKTEDVKRKWRFSCGCKRSQKSLNGLKKCICCKIKKTIENFAVCKIKKDGYQGRCKDCIKNSYLKRIFGITLDEYNNILTKQNNKCAICLTDNPSTTNSKKRFFSVDHCHATNKIRGLLCSKCNVAIGTLGDNSEGIYKAFIYLKNFENSLL